VVSRISYTKICFQLVLRGFSHYVLSENGKTLVTVPQLRHLHETSFYNTDDIRFCEKVKEVEDFLHLLPHSWFAAEDR